MKTLYLHIGMPKTATSLIQTFLAENWNVLQKYGYFFPESLHKYPGVSERRNAHFLLGKVMDKDGNRDKEAEKQYCEEGMKQIRKAFENYDHVILSDESIWYTLSYFKKSLLRDLKQEADKQQFQIRVIVYLRRQDTFLISRWNQGIKQNSSYASVMTCDEYLEVSPKKEEKIYRYAKKLDEIAAVVGKENIIVRRFEPESWKDGSMIHDFMQAIGLEVTEEYKEPEKSVNLRLDKNATEIKRILNSDEYFTEKEIFYMGKFLKEISKDYLKKEKTEVLAKEELQQFLNMYEEENQRVAEEYIKDGKPLFSDEIEDLPKWSAHNDTMQEEMIRFFTEVVMELRRMTQMQQKQIRKQEEKILKLEKSLSAQKKDFQVFREKVRHPFHTIWRRVFQV